MDITLLLAQIFGLYFLIVGVVLVVRHKTLPQIINSLLTNEGLMFFAGVFILLLGLLLVLVHNSWEAGLAWIITLIAWLTLIKGVLYMLFPSVLASIANWFNTRGLYAWGGVVAIIVGLYLTSQGFGLL